MVGEDPVIRWLLVALGVVLAFIVCAPIVHALFW